MQERMASEVAAMEKKRQGGNGKAGKGVNAGGNTNSQTTQTDTDTAELPIAAQQINHQLSVLQAELHKKDQALAAAHALHSELRAAHDSVLRHAEPVRAEHAGLIEQARQAHSAEEAHEQLNKKLTQEVKTISLQLKHLQAQHSELQSQHACLQATAKSLQASEVAHKAKLHSMTQHDKASQGSCSDLEASNLATAQQLEKLQTRSSQLEQTQQQLQVLIADAAWQVQGTHTAVVTPAEDGSLLSAATALIDHMQRHGQEAKAEAVKLTEQLQEAQAAQALEVEQLRYGLAALNKCLCQSNMSTLWACCPSFQ